MTLATEFAQPVPVSEPRPRLAVVPAAGVAPHPVPRKLNDDRYGRAPDRLAEVHVLRPPADVGSASWHLTRRGVAVLSIAVAALGVALVWLAARSAPAVPAGTSAVRGPSVVTVRVGDTLWQIASRVAPDVDPRAEVARLQQVNGLTGVELSPGQQLRVR